MTTVLVKNADRMMTSAQLASHGLKVTFADGRTGLVPFAAVPETAATAPAEVDLPNPYVLVLRTSSGETVEFPWDFVRHYCDESYRPRVETIAGMGREALGTRVRTLRESAHLTQEQLAAAAGIGRVTLSRIETGEHSPRYQTLVSLAKALGQPVGALVME